MKNESFSEEQTKFESWDHHCAWHFSLWVCSRLEVTHEGFEVMQTIRQAKTTNVSVYSQDLNEIMLQLGTGYLYNLFG